MPLKQAFFEKEPRCVESARWPPAMALERLRRLEHLEVHGSEPESNAKLPPSARAQINTATLLQAKILIIAGPNSDLPSRQATAVDVYRTRFCPT